MSGVRDLLRRKSRAAPAEDPERARGPAARDPGRAAADRGDHVLPRRGPDAAAVDPLLRRAVRHTRTSTSSTTTPRTAPPTTCPATCCTSRRSATASSTAPGWRWSATSAARCSSCTTWCCSATPTSSSSPTPTATPTSRSTSRPAPPTGINAVGSLGFNVVHDVGAEPPLDLDPAAARPAPAREVPAADVQAGDQVGPGALELGHPRRADAVRRRPGPVDVPHEVRRPRPPAGGGRPPAADGRGRRPLARHPVAPGRRHPGRAARADHRGRRPADVPEFVPPTGERWPTWSPRTRPATSGRPRARR